MLYDEFLKGINENHSNGTLYAYDKINRLYMNDKLKTKNDCYKEYEANRNDYMWVNEMNIGQGRNAKKSEDLNSIITNERAREIISNEFGFDEQYIEICGLPYFEVWDYNHIAFMVKGYARVYNNGELYDIYR